MYHHLMLLWALLTGGVRTEEACDGYMRQSVCLESERCAWKSCLASQLRCADQSGKCATKDKVMIEVDVDGHPPVCVPLVPSSSALNGWTCDEDPKGYPPCPEYAHRKCVVGIHPPSEHPPQDDPGLGLGIVGGIPMLILRHYA